MQLSKNFSLAEMTKSQTATRMGMDNNPSEDEVENLRLLCERVLQPVRDHFNHTVTISSGFRNIILSQKIGSSAKSQHCQGEAADFEIFGTPNIPVDTAEVSEEVVQTSSLPSNINQNTGLTAIEEALLSNEEKAMRLRNKGVTA